MQVLMSSFSFQDQILYLGSHLEASPPFWGGLVLAAGLLVSSSEVGPFLQNLRKQGRLGKGQKSREHVSSFFCVFHVHKCLAYSILKHGLAFPLCVPGNPVVLCTLEASSYPTMKKNLKQPLHIVCCTVHTDGARVAILRLAFFLPSRVRSF